MRTAPPIRCRRSRRRTAALLGALWLIGLAGPATAGPIGTAGTVGTAEAATHEWDTADGTVFVVPDGERFSVEMNLTSASGISGMSLTTVYPYGAVDVSSRRVTPTHLVLTVSGTLTGSNANVAFCPSTGAGLTCQFPRLNVVFEPRQRPVVTAPDVTVPAGSVLRAGATVATPRAATLSATALPAWLTLEPDGEAWVLTGTPRTADAGRHEITLVADNGVTGTTTMHVDVTAPPSFSGPVAETLVVGREPSVVVRAAGHPAPATSVDGALPPGVSAVDDGAGGLRLTGAPTSTGTWTVTVGARNAHGEAGTTLTLTVEAEPAFALTSASLSPRRGSAVTWRPDVEGVPAPVVTLDAGTLPPGLALAADGTLTGTPSAAGRYELVLRAANLHGEDLLPVTLDVLSAPVVPGRFLTYTFAADTPVSWRFRTGGWEPPGVESLFDQLPPGLVLTRIDATTWEFSGSVAYEDRGLHRDVFRVANSVGYDLFSAQWSVTAPLRWSGPTVVEAETGVPVPEVELAVTGYPLADVVVDAGSSPVTGLRTEQTQEPDESYDFATSAHVRTAVTFTAAGEHTLTFHMGGSAYPVTFVVRDRPRIAVPDSLTLAAGVAVDAPVGVAGSPTATLAAEGLPAGLFLAPDGAGAWRITGTPTGATGTYAVTLTADNGLVTTREVEVVVVVRPVVETPPAGPPAGPRIEAAPVVVPPTTDDDGAGVPDVVPGDSDGDGGTDPVPDDGAAPPAGVPDAPDGPDGSDGPDGPGPRIGLLATIGALAAVGLGAGTWALLARWRRDA